MANFKLRNSNFQFYYPDDWEVGEEGNIVSVYDRKKGVGSVQFSIYYISNSREVVLRDELNEILSGKAVKFEIQESKNRVFSDYVDDKDNRYWKYWLILKDNTLVVATYNCGTSDIKKESKIVEEIIKTIF